MKGPYRMDGHAIRVRMVTAMVAALAGSGYVLAIASPPTLSTLQSQARTEFTLAGEALRERLQKEADGDLVGARIAAQAAEAHRFRFLDLQRELARRAATLEASPSVAARRDPFAPDSSFLSLSFSARNSSSSALRVDEENRARYRPWDMYRVRDTAPSLVMNDLAQESSPTFHKNSGDLYMNHSPSAAAESPTVPSDGDTVEAARAPFFVYRSTALAAESASKMGQGDFRRTSTRSSRAQP
jgi:hypothetical protein